MKKILLPIDGTERSMKAVELVRELYKPDEADIMVMIVCEDSDNMRSQGQFDEAKKELEPVLAKAAHQLPGYRVRKKMSFGRAGDEILEVAKSEDVDSIVMTKSTRSGWFQMIGSVTTHVVKYASCIVMIVPE